MNLPAGERGRDDRAGPGRPAAGAGWQLPTQIGIGGHPGVAGLETPADGLADGIYRMTVAMVGGAVSHWYLEVGPDGRQAAEINAVRDQRSAVDRLPGHPVDRPRQDRQPQARDPQARPVR